MKFLLFLIILVILVHAEALYYEAEDYNGDISFVARYWCLEDQCFDMKKSIRGIITKETTRYCPESSINIGYSMGCAILDKSLAVSAFGTNNETLSFLHHELLHHYFWNNFNEPNHTIEFWKMDCEIRKKLNVYPRACLDP